MENIRLYHLLYFCVFIFIALNWLDMTKVFEYPNDAIKYHSFEMTAIFALWARVEQKMSGK